MKTPLCCMKAVAIFLVISGHILSLQAGTLFLDPVFTQNESGNPQKKKRKASKVDKEPAPEDPVPEKKPGPNQIQVTRDIKYGESKVIQDKSLLLQLLDPAAARDFYMNSNPATIPLTTMDLYLDLYKPDDSTASQKLPERLPAIVFAHGGGFVKGNKNQGNQFCMEFAQRGYVAVSVQYRLATNLPPLDEPGPNPETNLPPQLIKAAVNDLIKAVQWLKENADTYHVDPDRIIVGGLSAGAGASLGAAYLDDKDFPPEKQSTIKVAAVVDFAGGLAGLEYLIDADDPPVFIVHGKSDAISPFKYTLAMIKRLEEVGVGYSLMTAEKLPHAIKVSDLAQEDRMVEGKSMLQHLFEFCFEKLRLIELLPTDSEPKPVVANLEDPGAFKASTASHKSDSFQYQIHVSEDKKDWKSHGDPQPGNGNELTIQFSPAEKPRYYRWETTFSYPEISLSFYSSEESRSK